MNDTQVCTFRPSMKFNCILDKPDVGCPKIPLCFLPPEDFTYGNLVKSSGTAKEALIHWHNARQKISQAKKDPLGDDYLVPYSRIKLNRIPDVTFGIPSQTEASEDIKAIMCNAYQQKFVEEMKQKELKRREKIQEKTDRVTKSRQVIVRVSPKSIEDSSPLWKMKKFSNVKAKVSTWRTDD